MINSPNKTLDLSDISFIKRVRIGSMNPNETYSDQHQEEQMAVLNRCIGGTPRGKIIARDIAVGIYQIGEHQITMQQTTYHIGFIRKPHWLSE